MEMVQDAAEEEGKPSSPPKQSKTVLDIEQIVDLCGDEEERIGDHEENNLEGGSTKKEEEEDDKQKSHTSEAKTMVIPESSVKEYLVVE
ncbi:hypothetical protein KI387_032724, partial [Taxus chinensis]